MHVYLPTLVDRIVTGYPRRGGGAVQRVRLSGQLNRNGRAVCTLGNQSAKDISKEFPLPDAGLPVIFTDNQKPYKQRKVRILNGRTHPSVLASYLCGNDIVLESMQDELIFNFMKATIFDEVIPT